MSADQIIIARHLEHMRQRGLSPYTIYQELLGHASPQSTAGYAQYDRADAAAAVASLPAPGRLRAVAS
jgi:integrase